MNHKIEYIKLNDFLILSDSGTWGELNTTGLGVPVLRSSNVHEYELNFDDYASVIIPDKDKKRKKLITGDIIVTKSSGSPELIGKSAIFYNPNNGKDYYFSNFMLRLRVRTDVLNFKWLHYWLSSNIGRRVLFNMNNTTSGLRNLNNNLYLNQKIPVLPLNDQKRIVEILDKADALRQKRKQALALLDELLRSTFLEMFGEPVSNPKKWEQKTLPALIQNEKNSIKRGPFGSTIKKDIFVKEGYLVYEQSHAIQDNFKIGRYYITEEKYKELEDFKVLPGDLIISCSGVTLGKIAEIPKNAKPGIINQALLKIALDQNKINNIYFKFLFRYEKMQNIIFGVSRGSGIPNFPPVSTIKKIPLSTPPIELQTQFAKIVGQTEATKAKMQQSLQELDNQFQALMQRAFMGEL